MTLFLHSLIVMPTERSGYFSFIVTGENADSEALVADEDALRQTLRDHAERQDLTFGRFEAVSSWRFVCCKRSQARRIDNSLTDPTFAW